jgi:hypothetical protein
LYTYTQDSSTHTITQSQVWSTAGFDTESGKPLYTTTKWDGCYQGDKMWPRVESDDSPNMQLIINSLIYNTVVENQRILKTQRCSLINKRKKCKAAGCVWNKKECLWSEDVSNESGMLGMINAMMNGLITGGIDHSNGGGTLGPPSGLKGCSTMEEVEMCTQYNQQNIFYFDCKDGNPIDFAVVESRCSRRMLRSIQRTSMVQNQK